MSRSKSESHVVKVKKEQYDSVGDSPSRSHSKVNQESVVVKVKKVGKQEY